MILSAIDPLATAVMHLCIMKLDHAKANCSQDISLNKKYMVHHNYQYLLTNSFDNLTL